MVLDRLYQPFLCRQPLALALLLVVSLAAGSGFTYVVWNTTQPAEPTVVLGEERLNGLATVKQIVQVTVTEEETRASLRSPCLCF
jgi:hypothetical protein